MKFTCLGYFDEARWDQLSEAEQATHMEDCFAYDDELRRGGHFLGGEALQSAENAATLRYQNGRVTVTDGPYAETKEYLGGVLILEARDLNHAIQLMSQHPGVRFGPFEIRPADEAMNAQIEARNQSFQHA
ncbi:MAG: YciI family protein [Synechococcales bacterium]|nr:YciI family protein [Synechococcales bacterium]